MSAWTTERAKVAGLSRAIRNGERPENDPALITARRNLRALRLEEHIKKVISEAPPLTDEQRDRIANLLRAGGAAQ